MFIYFEMSVCLCVPPSVANRLVSGHKTKNRTLLSGRSTAVNSSTKDYSLLRPWCGWREANITHWWRNITVADAVVIFQGFASTIRPIAKGSPSEVSGAVARLSPADPIYSPWTYVSIGCCVVRASNVVLHNVLHRGYVISKVYNTPDVCIQNIGNTLLHGNLCSYSISGLLYAAGWYLNAKTAKNACCPSDGYYTYVATLVWLPASIPARTPTYTFCTLTLHDRTKHTIL